MTDAPRWVWWTSDTARTLVAAGLRPARCWDLEAVLRLLAGGSRGAADGLGAPPWPRHCGLPRLAEPDLFSPPTTTDHVEAVRPDGHLDPSWIETMWSSDLDHLGTWARSRSMSTTASRPTRPAPGPSGRAEHRSIGVRCGDAVSELEADGLPVDVLEAERIISSFIGPRPSRCRDERRLARARDELVLQHVPGAKGDLDVRNPAGVKSMLRRVGIEVPRHPRLASRAASQRARDRRCTAHLAPAERIATTFGYRWLDQHVGPDGRLRGRWSPSDGAAGRMTATAGLHNMPAELRPAIVAEPGHAFVSADLGQIEPRILASVSSDEALAAATWEATCTPPSPSGSV